LKVENDEFKKDRQDDFLGVSGQKVDVFCYLCEYLTYYCLIGLYLKAINVIIDVIMIVPKGVINLSTQHFVSHELQKTFLFHQPINIVVPFEDDTLGRKSRHKFRQDHQKNVKVFEPLATLQLVKCDCYQMIIAYLKKPRVGRYFM
jgi:hypothetical protein